MRRNKSKKRKIKEKKILSETFVKNKHEADAVRFHQYVIDLLGIFSSDAIG